MTDDDARDATPSTPIGRLLASAEAATEPLVESVSSAIGAAINALSTMPGRRVRQVRRRGHSALPSLPELHPEARLARPVEVGLRTIDVDDVRGTAVGGGDQRGGDFLPLRPFRGANWNARWQRLRRAHDRLADLPPIEVVKYDGGYWVIDGHNRVALALYAGQVGIDASIVELVPPGGQRTEPIGSLAAEIEESRLVRGRVDTVSEAAEADRDAADSADGAADRAAAEADGIASSHADPEA